MSTKLTESYLGIKGEEEYVDNVKTTPDCLKHYAEKLGGSEAIVFAAYDGRQRIAISWNDVYKNSVKVAKSLIALGMLTFFIFTLCFFNVLLNILKFVILLFCELDKRLSVVYNAGHQ